MYLTLSFLFIVWHRCYGKRSRFLETACGGVNCEIGAINLVVFQSTVLVFVWRDILGKNVGSWLEESYGEDGVGRGACLAAERETVVTARC